MYIMGSQTEQTECRKNGDTEWNLNGLKVDTAAVKRTKNIPTIFRAEKENTFFISLLLLKENGIPKSRSMRSVCGKCSLTRKEKTYDLKYIKE